MLDTMTMTKAGGAICITFLVLLLGKWAAEEIYHVGLHGAPSYVIDTGADEDAAEEVVEVVDFGPIYASADASKGEGLFRACAACHNLDGTDGTGPHLDGVVDREIGSVAGFGYSDALAGMAGTAWTPDELQAFLENPKGYAPGTKMAYNGMRKIEDRADLIAYLATYQ